MTQEPYQPITSNSNLVEEYSRILDQIGQLIPQEGAIDELGIKLMTSPSLTPEDKEIHLTLLTHLSRLNEEIQIHYWMSEHLKVLHEFGNTLSRTLSKEEIYYKAFQLVARVMDADAFFIALYNEETSDIHFPFFMEAGERFESFHIKFGEGIVSKVITSREIMHLKTSNEHDSIGALVIGDEENQINSGIYIPLIFGDQIKGVISAQSVHQFNYKKEHVELLRIIGSQVVNAVENTILYESIYERSIRDDLTNLMNRRAFNKDLDDRIKKANETNSSVVLIMFDADNLKMVNDLYGHHIGDIYIKQIAKALLSNCVDGETAYRYAGDEFMIIAPKLTINEALIKVNAIQSFLHKNPITILGNSIPITASVGIVSYPEHSKDADELKRFVDEALYYGKSTGKNEVNIYNKDY